MRKRSWVSAMLKTSAGKSAAVCISSRLISMPKPPEEPISDVAQVKPPPPRSLKPISMPDSRTSRKRSSLALKSTFFKKGSGICTAPRLVSSSSSRRASEAKVTPPKPDESVGLPIKITS